MSSIFNVDDELVTVEFSASKDVFMVGDPGVIEYTNGNVKSMGSIVEILIGIAKIMP